MAVKKLRLKPRSPKIEVTSGIVRRRLTVDGKLIDVSLEGIYWNALKQIATIKETKVRDLVAQIKQANPNRRLVSEIRVFTLNFYRDRAFSVY